MLIWTSLKDSISALGRSLDVLTRENRFAAENGLIDDVERWVKFHKSRNETSHTYDGDTAHDVIAAAYDFLPSSQELLARLKGERHD